MAGVVTRTPGGPSRNAALRASDKIALLLRDFEERKRADTRLGLAISALELERDALDFRQRQYATESEFRQGRADRADFEADRSFDLAGAREDRLNRGLDVQIGREERAAAGDAATGELAALINARRLQALGYDPASVPGLAQADPAIIDRLVRQEEAFKGAEREATLLTRMLGSAIEKGTVAPERAQLYQQALSEASDPQMVARLSEMIQADIAEGRDRQTDAINRQTHIQSLQAQLQLIEPEMSNTPRARASFSALQGAIDRYEAGSGDPDSAPDQWEEVTKAWADVIRNSGPQRDEVPQKFIDSLGQELGYMVANEDISPEAARAILEQAMRRGVAPGSPPAPIGINGAAQPQLDAAAESAGGRTGLLGRLGSAAGMAGSPPHGVLGGREKPAGPRLAGVSNADLASKVEEALPEGFADRLAGLIEGKEPEEAQRITDAEAYKFARSALGRRAAEEDVERFAAAASVYFSRMNKGA